MRIVLMALLLGLVPWSAWAQGSLNLTCSVQIEWCQAAAVSFARDTGVKVSMTQRGSGEALATLRAEAQNPRTDIWFGGSAETHLAAAEQNLLQPYASPNLAALYPWARKIHDTAKGMCTGISSGAIGFVYNKEIFTRRNLPVPHSWADLLKPIYKGEIQLPNPNSSGTAYTIIAGLVQLWDEDRAFAYLKDLNRNVNAYTRSGAAPVQAVARGETGLAVSFNMETESLVQHGFPVAITYPEEGTSYEVACLSIIRGASSTGT